MGAVRDLYMARKMGAGVNVPAPDLSTMIKRKAYSIRYRFLKLTHGIWANGIFYPHTGTPSKYIAVESIVPVTPGATYHLTWVDDPSNAVSIASYCAFTDNEFLETLSTTSSTVTIPSGVNGLAFSFITTTEITEISDINIKNVLLTA